MMKTCMRVKLAMLALLAPLAANAADAPGAGSDSGMVTQVQGGVTYASGNDKNKPVVAFMKVRAGDKLVLPPDAKLQLVYFQGGRQEAWRGATQLEVGSAESRVANAANPPEIKQLPALVLQQLARAPNVVIDLKNRTGMVFVRSLPTRDRLRELDETYAAMRKDAVDDDVTPELFLLSGLHELRLYRDMKPVLEEMRRRQPDNAEAKVAYEQYSNVMSNAEGRGR